MNIINLNGSNPDTEAPPEATEGGQKESQAAAMVRLAQESGAEFFHDSRSDAYATAPIGNHRETFMLKGNAATAWLRHLYFIEAEKPPGSQRVQDALNLLRALAQFEGDEHEVHVRLAGGPTAVYLDLGDPDWRAVEVTDGGWRVVDDPPVRFRRPRGLLALPEPRRGGSLDELCPFLNLTGDDFRLAVLWLVAALLPAGPYPVLNLGGEQGSAKSTTASVLRALLDPNVAGLRAEPRDGRDLMIAASNGWCVSFDNLSGIRPWLSDALCRLATGGGFSTRELYSDGDEVIFDAQRPVLLTGIEEVATRGDLVDRSIALNLPRIPDSERRDEQDFWPDFEAARPRILGALLDAVALVLRDRNRIRLSRRPRMADFAQSAAAAAPAVGWTPDDFLTAYALNRAGSRTTAVESSLVGVILMKFLQARDAWDGFIGELLPALSETAGEPIARQKEWPKSSRALSGELRRLAPALTAVGIKVSIGKHTKNGTPIALEKVAETPSPPSHRHPTGLEEVTVGDGGDGRGDGVAPDRHPSEAPSNRFGASPGDGGDGGDGVLPGFSSEHSEPVEAFDL